MESSGCCGDRSEGCNSSLNRRELLQLAGACASTLSLAHLGTAGPVQLAIGASFEDLIPSDKQLDPRWLAALSTRQSPEVLQGWQDKLRLVGMPVGGIACGQLYLGGDGRLWLWDIFKSNYRREPDHGQRIDAFTLGGHYAHPVAFAEEYTPYNGAKVQQGFALRMVTENATLVRPLSHVGFPAVTFRGEYPIGKVCYRDDALPVTVQLEAFSPFIPLNARDSGLPATVMSFTVTNEGPDAIEVDLVGWLQNATCPYVSDPALGQRRNRFVSLRDRCTLLQSIESSAPSTNAPLDAQGKLFGEDRASGHIRGIESRHGYGTMALSLINPSHAERLFGCADRGDGSSPEALFANLDPLTMPPGASATPLPEQIKPLDEPLIGALGATLRLEPGATKSLDFAVTWYFPDYQETDQAPGFLSQLQGFETLRRHYAPWFNSASDVAGYLAAHQERLWGETRLWNRTWYDSTLPHWFLDRTFVSIDCAATQVLHWFDSGRLYGWEGVDCCPGTCTHVWHYAQGLGRIFPELERSFREITDYGIAFHEDTGLIGYRAESHDAEATDGQAGTILRAYREHQMSADREFLRRLWPKVKRSIQFLIAKDPDRNGLIEGPQPHTLDAAWYGPMAWISGLYLAALTAGVAMAEEMEDEAFAEQCRTIAESGRKSMVAELFDGEYFIHRPDPQVPEALRSGKGCHIDQVLGQAWAMQVGLPRIVPRQETLSALDSLWRYNFAPDAGAYAIAHRAIEQSFRWYAMPGEAGLLMCTWPKGGAEEAIPGGRLRPSENPSVWTGPGGYFNECMNGFEYQVAAHMIYEGAADSSLVEKGLAIVRAIHERYAPGKRNPYNEIECSDHYARSMASYGAFLAACGFEYHGPAGRIGFAPRIAPGNFRAAFTAAEGWGSFSQRRDGEVQYASLELRWGRLELNQILLQVPQGRTVEQCNAHVGEVAKAVSCHQDDDQITITFAKPLQLTAGLGLRIQLT